MNRLSVQHDGLTFSYLDPGGSLPALIALHAHWMEATTFSPLADALSAEWRVIALDQRGHGYSDHSSSYGREDYLGDLDAFFQHLGWERAVLLGNSLGGVNAYQDAARHPERVRGLIIEDIGVDLSGEMPPISHWAGTFPTRQELEDRIGARMLPYLQDSLRQRDGAWTLAFEPADMSISGAGLKGSYWQDWMTTTCPALLIRGSESRVTTAAHIAEMAERRPNTRLVTLNGSHVLHHDDPAGFSAAVQSFLRSLP